MRLAPLPFSVLLPLPAPAMARVRSGPQKTPTFPAAVGMAKKAGGEARDGARGAHVLAAQPKIIDFGIARIARPGRSHSRGAGRIIAAVSGPDGESVDVPAAVAAAHRPDARPAGSACAAGWRGTGT